jgi:ParB-like chromosome segregation protein Spo0J
MSESPSPYQLLPDLSSEEFKALKTDIAASGVRVPVVIDAETGAVVDGHHRIKAVEELRAEGLKVPDYPRQVIRFPDDEERASFVLAANLFRRHLTKTQRRELVTNLRSKGWSLRRISDALGIGPATVHRDLGTDPDGAVPERIVGKDGRSQPAKRPPSLFVTSRRDEGRARAALVALPEGTAPTSLLRAEERAREAGYKARRQAADVAASLAGPDYELRVGDLRTVWEDVPDRSIDAIVTDPPYNEDGLPLYGDLARLAARVLKPGRLVAVYCGHVHLDEEMRLLEGNGLTYVWHGVNMLGGRHTKIRGRMVNGRHRSVLLFSAGPYVPRKWIHDTFIAQGQGGPETRPLHPWQQAVEPVTHWVQMTSEPGELVMDPFLGSGTTAVAAVASGRRFLGGDIEAGNVATARERLESDLPGEMGRTADKEA